MPFVGAEVPELSFTTTVKFWLLPDENSTTGELVAKVHVFQREPSVFWPVELVVRELPPLLSAVTETPFWSSKSMPATNVLVAVEETKLPLKVSVKVFKAAEFAAFTASVTLATLS
jgi:hypothetical protein